MSVAAKGRRLPKNHQLVYEILRTAGHGVHLSTADLFARAKSSRPTIGFSTVYRGILRLRELELIDEIAVPGSDAAVYEVASRPHAHFRCDRCGIVQDVEFQLAARTIAELRKRTCAQIDRSKLTLHGLCAVCRT